MFDLLMLGLTATAFAAFAGYVAWCDRIIGPDPENAVIDVEAIDRPQSNAAEPRKVGTA